MRVKAVKLDTMQISQKAASLVCPSGACSPAIRKEISHDLYVTQ